MFDSLAFQPEHVSQIPVKHLAQEMEYQKNQEDHTRVIETTASQTQSFALLKRQVTQ
jgi:hypothetical protein